MVRGFSVAKAQRGILSVIRPEDGKSEELLQNYKVHFDLRTGGYIEKPVFAAASGLELVPSQDVRLKRLW
jgi:hypothetical protein